MVNNWQNLVNVVCERLLFSKYPNREEDHRTLCHSSMYQGQGTKMDRKTQKFLLLDHISTVQSQFSDILFSDNSQFSDNFAEDHYFST